MAPTFVTPGKSELSPSTYGENAPSPQILGATPDPKNSDFGPGPLFDTLMFYEIYAFHPERRCYPFLYNLLRGGAFLEPLGVLSAEN